MPVLDAALDRTLLAARDKREQRGASGDGRVVVSGLSAEEALALDGLLEPRRTILAGGQLRVSLSALEAALRACGAEPLREYQRVGARPVRDLPAERESRLQQRAGFRSWLAAHQVVEARPELGPWLQEAARQGRINADMRRLVEQALAIVAALPAPQRVQRTVLAARMLDGDPHALDVGTPLHGLTVSLLALSVGLDPATPPREIWAAWNVLVDPVSSNVAVLNLPLLGDGIAARLTGQLRGTHLILTHGQLASGDFRWPEGVPCFSCENPSVLVAAEQTLGPSCPPVLCTGGRPSDAGRLLLRAIHRAGGQLRHHGDFDEAGVQILRDLQARYDAIAWRFDPAALERARGSYRRAVAVGGTATLEQAVSSGARTVPEELVIGELLEDLRTPD